MTTTPRPDLPYNTVICGDALEVLRTLPDNSVDAIVTDPPAGISFMGRLWDADHGGRGAWVAGFAAIYREALRVLKPGGHALVWALPRTSHWTALALEDAGFEIRDRVAHIFGQGFPKALDVGKALDELEGATRTPTGESYYGATNIGKGSMNSYIVGAQEHPAKISAAWRRMEGRPPPARTTVQITKPVSDLAKQWDGWATALKPAVEDWWLCRKPLAESSVAANIKRWGVGALNIDACRVEGSGRPLRRFNPEDERRDRNTYSASRPGLSAGETDGGRWPAHLLLSHTLFCTPEHCAENCPVADLDRQGGGFETRSGLGPNAPGRPKYAGKRKPEHLYGGFPNAQETVTMGRADDGYVSRYFSTFYYGSKARFTEREAGTEHLEARYQDAARAPGSPGGTNPRNRGAQKQVHNHHPTVKSLALMDWLIRLVTPPRGVVLDCFAGSGSTLVAAKAGGWQYIGIEREPAYVAIAEARLKRDRFGGQLLLWNEEELDDLFDRYIGADEAGADSDDDDESLESGGVEYGKTEY